jgi:hypothetical protein
VIAFLRFVGLLNAAIWLGAAVFFTFGARPACVSPEMETLLGAKNFPFFSGAFEQLVMARYFFVLSLSGVIALLHLLAEWLYMGRPARKFSLALLAGLLTMVLIGGVWVEPRLKKLHATRYAANTQSDQRDAAAKSFRVWQACSQVINLVMIAGLVVYVWRVANPSDAPRFISSVKFRG